MSNWLAAKGWLSITLRRQTVRMVVKEEISLLPSSVREPPGAKEKSVSIRRTFHWLQIATFALVFGWLALLSVRSWQPVPSKDVFNELMRGQELR